MVSTPECLLRWALPSCILCKSVSPVLGLVVCPVSSLLMDPRRVVGFSVCSTAFYLLAWSGDFQVPWVWNRKLESLRFLQEDWILVLIISIWCWNIQFLWTKGPVFFFFLQDRIGNVECIWNEREINLNISNKVQERSWKYFPKIKTRQNFEYVMMFKSIKMKFLFIVFPCKLSKFTCWKEMYMFLYFLLIVGMYNVHFVTYRLFLSFFKILYSN